MASILKVSNLSVAFPDQEVISDLSFEVSEGESLAIIGPNGSGKSVLLRALVGAVLYTGLVEWANGARIGYVPQKLNLERDLPLTLGDFMNTKIKIVGATQSEALEALSKVKLPASFLSKKLGFLSGGQFQRALIAFALIGKPNVLLFDEPTSGVDLPREEQIYETLHRLQDDGDLTLILVSHDLSLVYKHASQVLCLNKSLVCEGIPQEVLTAETLQKLYGDRVLYHHGHNDEH
jgi:zinc transport system ATP-binding protein